MLIKLVAALAATGLMGTAQATPVTIDFTGIQNPVVLNNGASNFLNLSYVSPVHGSFTIDLDGFADQRSSDPLDAFYSGLNTTPVKRASFQTEKTEQPFSNIGPYGGYGYYHINAANNTIDLYANSVYQTSTGVTSDLFIMALFFAPNVLIDDRYNVGHLNSNDLFNLGKFGSNNTFEFRRTEDIFGSWKSVTYSGYLTDVSATVSPVPAPPALILMLTGLGLLGLTKRFRKEV